MVNCLDPDQDRCSVGPDLGPNFFKGYQQMTKVAASKQGELKEYICCGFYTFSSNRQVILTFI